MTHETLVNTIFNTHIPLVLAVAVAYYKYGDRTDNISKALQGIESLLTKLRRQLAEQLRVHIEPVIKKSINQTTSSILKADGSAYSEEVPNLTESETFRESLNAFINLESGSMVDLRTAILSRNQWCKHAVWLSWILLTLIGWILLVSASVFVLEKLLDIRISEWMLHSTWFIIGVLITLGLVCLGLMQNEHDNLCHLRMKYDSP